MKLKRMSIVLAFVLAFSLIVTGCTQSKKSVEDTVPAVEETVEDDSLQRVLDAGVLVVVGSGGYPPFNFINDSGDVIGFDVEVGEEIAARLGVELDYKTGEWSGLVEALRNARYDAILGSMAITEARQEVVNFTIPYYYSGAQLVVRADSGITDTSEMEGKTIAVATGTNYVQDAEGLGAETALYDDDTLTMIELINGRVHGVITDRLVALKAMEEMQRGDELVLSGEIIRLEEMGIAINKDDTSLLEAINGILQEMHEDGTLTAISESWQNGADITVK